MPLNKVATRTRQRLARAAKLWFEDHHSMMRYYETRPWSLWAPRAYLSPPPSLSLSPQYSLRYPQCWPDRADTRIFRHQLPASDWSEVYSLGFSLVTEARMWTDTPHYVMTQEPGPASGHSASAPQLWGWQIRKGGGRVKEPLWENNICWVVIAAQFYHFSIFCLHRNAFDYCIWCRANLQYCQFPV